MIRANILAFTNDANGYFPPPKKLHFFIFSMTFFHNKKVTYIKFLFFMKKNSSREARTTAEPPEPLTFQHPEFIFFKQILQQNDGPAARHSV